MFWVLIEMVPLGTPNIGFGCEKKKINVIVLALRLGGVTLSLTLSLPNFWGNILLSAKYILGKVTTEGLAV